MSEQIAPGPLQRLPVEDADQLAQQGVFEELVVFRQHALQVGILLLDEAHGVGQVVSLGLAHSLEQQAHLDAAKRGPHLGVEKVGNGDGRQDSDDGHDNEEFDKGETSLKHLFHK